VPVSYEKYREWCRTLTDKELNKEIDRNTAKCRQTTGQVREAWGRMLSASIAEQKRRDDVPLSKHLGT